MTETDTDPPAVVLAYVCGNNVTYSWHRSMVQAIGYERGNGRTLYELAMRHGTGGLVEARNQAVHDFLHNHSDVDWLLWLDTDMGFPANTVERLLEAADPIERPIVGALCFSQHETTGDGMGGWRCEATPTIFDWLKLDDQQGYAVRWDYPVDTVTQCHGTGSACVLIHRSVFERMGEKFHTWYDRVPNPSLAMLISEDLSFCVRAGALDIPVFVHTGVKTTHQKSLWLCEEDYLAQRLARTMASQLPTVAPSMQAYVDIDASLKSLAGNAHVQAGGMLKLPQDLDRYAQIIEATKPEVIVETGTLNGGSSRWFADLGLDVITVDVNEVLTPIAYRDRITQVVGSAADPDIAAKVAELVAGRRAMVSLDSDHSGPHVAEEIKLYGPLVSPGCYLVVEDGIFGYAPPALRAQHGLGDMVGSPLDAIAEHLDGSPDWSRDVAVERLSDVSHHPSGFWVKVGSDA